MSDSYQADDERQPPERLQTTIGRLRTGSEEQGTNREQAWHGLARLSAIVQSSDDAIIGKNPDGTISSWNPAAEQLYGYSAAEAIGQPITLCVPPEWRAETMAALQRVLRGERLAHYETVRAHKNGTRFDVSVRVSPVVDASGAIIGASAISRDISERRRAERRQAAEHAVTRVAAEAVSFEEAAPRLLEPLCDNLGADIAELFIPDDEGLLQRGCAATPSSAAGADAVGSPPATLGFGWADQARQLRRTVWFTDMAAAGDDKTRRPEGAAMLGLRSGFAVPVIHGDDCLAVVSFGTREPLPPDSELLAMLAAVGQTIGQLVRRSRTEDALRQAVVKRDRFLAMMSHELLNPLAAVRAASVALQHEGIEREGRETAHGVILRQVQHMTHLVEDLLDVARMTQGRLGSRSSRSRSTARLPRRSKSSSRWPTIAMCGSSPNGLASLSASRATSSVCRRCSPICCRTPSSIRRPARR